MLAEDLLAHLRRVPLTGRVLPVDLEMLGTALEGDPGLSSRAYADLHTGGRCTTRAAPTRCWSGRTPPSMWRRRPTVAPVRPHRISGRWHDMAAVAQQQDAGLRKRLERAIEA
ncbi:hypothetical protein R1X32_05260 (plasmid) [Rhodococcus opacus]